MARPSTENDPPALRYIRDCEKVAPTGYLNTGVIHRTFTIRENGKVVEMTSADTAIKNDVIRGGVKIEKWDIERNEAALKQGDATLAGAVLDIYNTSKHLVLVDGVELRPRRDRADPDHGRERICFHGGGCFALRII